MVCRLAWFQLIETLLFLFTLRHADKCSPGISISQALLVCCVCHSIPSASFVARSYRAVSGFFLAADTTSDAKHQSTGNQTLTESPSGNTAIISLMFLWRILVFLQRGRLGKEGKMQAAHAWPPAGISLTSKEFSLLSGPIQLRRDKFPTQVPAPTVWIVLRA